MRRPLPLRIISLGLGRLDLVVSEILATFAQANTAKTYKHLVVQM